MEIEKILTKNINSLDIFKGKGKNINIAGLDDKIKPYFILSYLNSNDYLPKPFIFFTGEIAKSELLYKGLSFWNNFFSKLLKKTALYINKHIPDEDINSISPKEKITKAIFLSKLLSKQKEIFITSIKSISSLNFSYQEYKDSIVKIYLEQIISPEKLITQLDQIGYNFEEGTYRKGHFEKKGGIINLFPINSTKPIRIEFLGSRIESIYSFNLKNKKNIESFDSLSIHPINIKSPENQEKSFLLDYLEKVQPTIALDNPDTFEEIFNYNNSSYLYEFKNKTKNLNSLSFNSFSNNKNELRLSYKKIIPYQNNLKKFKEDILKKQKVNYKIIIITSYTKQFKNLFKSLKNINFIAKQKLNIIDNTSISGFNDIKNKLLLIFDKEILGEEIDIPKRKKVDRLFIAELNPDDFVVHLDHGVGMFKGTTQREIDEGKREFLIIEYDQGDKLFLPAEYTDKISKYIGSGKPKINRLHEVSWKELKHKAKEDAKKQAEELLQIYARRETSSGHIFSKDTKEQKDLEDSFPYQETPDQLKAIREIKLDMEGSQNLKSLGIKKPMDRLLCGDVGFGKTEVAVRAAFKATQDKKQVALLCPTTILAEQHFNTFQKRLKKIGTKVEVLSRFKSKKEQIETVKKIAAGKIDIIVGTHRLLSRDIEFKDLGLIIVDEEQRFGVKHKDKLKKLRPKIDILTLSATPIPRTLNLALSKLKSISTLETPPLGRKAVKTYITPHNDQKIIEAIETEVKREGQVYYLHNRVATINTQLKRLKKLLPKIHFGIIHGQLSEKEIAHIMDKFNIKKEIDVLICSSIIENGLDLPNVNTLIVDNAIMFGLADLHQLRGRIGRGDKKAHAYFFYKSERLKEKARKRLEALLAAKELGSGFQIAMQDLEIRGAGNILGKQQSGNIKHVGLSLYCQLLNQAVKEIKTGKKESLALDITIDLPISAYIPQDIIPDSKKRLKLYQSLAKIHNIKELQESKKELSQKYKALPIEFQNLFKILELKILAKNASIKSIDTKETHRYGDKNYRLVIKFNKVPPYKQIKELIKKGIELSLDEEYLKIDVKKEDKNKLLNQIENILIILKN